MRRSVLLVDDDDLVGRTIKRSVEDLARVQVASSLGEAREALRAAPLAGPAGFVGVVVDVVLGDGCGLEIVAEIAASRPSLPMLVYTGLDHAAVCNEAQLYGAAFLRKPAPMKNVRAFLQRAARVADRPRDVSSLVALAADRYGLSRRERELVQHVVRGARSFELPIIMGVSANTVRTMTRRVLGKTAARDLNDVLKRLIWLGFERV